MNKNYFDALQKTQEYEDKNYQLHLKKRVFNTFNNLLKTFYDTSFSKNQFLLDLGALDGTFIKVVKNFGLDGKGLDVNDLDLEKDQINLANESCDIVTAISLLEHLNNPNNFLKEVRRVLKKNGYLIIVTPNWNYSMKTFFDDPTHVRPYTTQSLKFLLELSGFRQIHILPWLVNKPIWMWKVPFKFFLAKIIPFRGDSYSWIPGILKGKSTTLLSVCIK